MTEATIQKPKNSEERKREIADQYCKLLADQCRNIFEPLLPNDVPEPTIVPAYRGSEHEQELKKAGIEARLCHFSSLNTIYITLPDLDHIDSIEELLDQNVERTYWQSNNRGQYEQQAKELGPRRVCDLVDLAHEYGHAYYSSLLGDREAPEVMNYNPPSANFNTVLSEGTAILFARIATEVIKAMPQEYNLQPGDIQVIEDLIVEENAFVDRQKVFTPYFFGRRIIRAIYLSGIDRPNREKGDRITPEETIVNFKKGLIAVSELLERVDPQKANNKRYVWSDTDLAFFDRHPDRLSRKDPVGWKHPKSKADAMHQIETILNDVGRN